MHPLYLLIKHINVWICLSLIHCHPLWWPDPPSALAVRAASLMPACKQRRAASRPQISKSVHSVGCQRAQTATNRWNHSQSSESCRSSCGDRTKFTGKDNCCKQGDSNTKEENTMLTHRGQANGCGGCGGVGGTSTHIHCSISEPPPRLTESWTPHS